MIDLTQLHGTSVDKSHQALAALNSIDPGDNEQLAQLLAAANMIGLPALLAAQLPDDPRQLDELLEQGATALLALRSDEADDLGVFGYVADSEPVYEDGEPA